MNPALSTWFSEMLGTSPNIWRTFGPNIYSLAFQLCQPPGMVFQIMSTICGDAPLTRRENFHIRCHSGNILFQTQHSNPSPMPYPMQDRLPTDRWKSIKPNGSKELVLISPLQPKRAKQYPHDGLLCLEAPITPPKKLLLIEFKYVTTKLPQCSTKNQL